MTRALALAYGLVAVLEEGDTDRPATPPAGPPVADHDWTVCSCARCAEWRRKAAALPPPPDFQLSS